MYKLRGKIQKQPSTFLIQYSAQNYAGLVTKLKPILAEIIRTSLKEYKSVKELLNFSSGCCTTLLWQFRKLIKKVLRRVKLYFRCLTPLES